MDISDVYVKVQPYRCTLHARFIAIVHSLGPYSGKDIGLRNVHATSRDE